MMAQSIRGLFGAFRLSTWKQLCSQHSQPHRIVKLHYREVELKEMWWWRIWRNCFSFPLTRISSEMNDGFVRRGLAALLSSTTSRTPAASERRIRELVNSRGQTLFTQSWMPTTIGSNAVKKLKGLVIVLHGLNEHSGRYAHFATRLNGQGYGVFAMDWIGHGGSDGLHGYVEALDQVVVDTRLYLKQVTDQHPGVPLFLFGHSTGGTIALKTSLLFSEEEKFSGIVLTAPALRVKRPNAIISAVAPIFSFLLPSYQFRMSSKAAVQVSRDTEANLAKVNDPLVYTGPIRIRTGLEILRLADFLEKNLDKITTPFLVLHGSQDQITNPQGSRDLFERAASQPKRILIYDGLLHDLLFELEKEDIMVDIIDWMNGILDSKSSYIRQ